MIERSEEYALIPLPWGLVSVVSREDVEEVKQYSWMVRGVKDDALYAFAKRKRESKKDWWERAERRGRCGGEYILLSHLLLKPEPGMTVDHVNHYTLNNRRENLRLATPFQQTCNRRPDKDSSSKYKGVYWDKLKRKWGVGITAKGKRYFLGYFTSEESAARAYDVLAPDLHGEFAYLNFPEKPYWEPIEIIRTQIPRRGTW